LLLTLTESFWKRADRRSATCGRGARGLNQRRADVGRAPQKTQQFISGRLAKSLSFWGLQ
jgi:hypothetical protein